MTLQSIMTGNDEAPRPSSRVRNVAVMLDADESQVRRLIKDGELKTHCMGKRGVRIYLDSVADYQRRKAREAAMAPEKPTVRRRRAVTTAAHKQALAQLRAAGLLP